MKFIKALFTCMFSNQPEDHKFKPYTEKYFTEDDTPILLERDVGKCEICGKLEDDNIDW